MGYFAHETFKSQNEGIQEAVSNTVGQDSKISNNTNAAGEKVKNSMKFIPENDIRIYTFCRDKRKVSMLG